ncbi:MAG: acylphosphatase [Elusimicrobia bacterium]|nr:acylphosphatase [Elusimicrobiota bacterium]
MTTRKHVVVRGLVQGVGYRWHARGAAERLGLSGWVRNRADGAVEAEAQGTPSAVAEFVAELRAGPPMARVESVEARDVPPKRDARSFEVVHEEG